MTFFGVEYSKEELLQREVFPLGMAPFIRLSVEGQEGGNARQPASCSAHHIQGHQ